MLSFERGGRFLDTPEIEVSSPLCPCGFPLGGGRWAGKLHSAPLAQSVERFHGKEKVSGSIPLGGSKARLAARWTGFLWRDSSAW